ncbi:hypothetical protein NQ314_016001, partial [Rhamnusium bicolor]
MDLNFILLIRAIGNEEERQEHRIIKRQLRDHSNPLTLPETTNQSKIIVYPNPNTITNTKVKPTSATVEHEPGVPPGWPSKTTTTRKPSHHKPFMKPNKPYHLFGASIRTASGTEVMENVVDSKPLIITDSSNITHQSFSNENPHRGNVIDWFLGVVGIRPPDPNPPSVTPAKDCQKCTCGQTFKQRRIVGGIETMVNQYPWMTALMYNNRFYCGASLINNKYVLTAAHCVNGFSRERLSAVFLDHDRSTDSETQTLMRKIKNIYRHSSYGAGGNYNNDIALLQLEQEVPVSGRLKPVCLPPTGKSFSGLQGIATGWGATKEHGQISNKLQEVTVPIMSNSDCRKTGYGYKITDNMLCAGFPHGNKDSCQ